MLEIFLARGYQELRVEDQSLFDPYYDSMNEHWSANTSFLNLIGWRESYPTYFKIAEGLLINITYLKLPNTLLPKLLQNALLNCYRLVLLLWG